MSILIKGMEMPERCGACFLRVGGCKQRIYMEQRPKNLSVLVESGGKPFDFRPVWCPLEEAERSKT